MDVINLNWKRMVVCSALYTDALVLKHQAIRNHSVDWMIIVLDQFHMEILQLKWTILGNKITSWKKSYPVV